MRGPRRMPWENEYDGSFSPDWVVGLLVVAILAAAALGFWFQEMYASGTGIFAPQ